jgi:O-antigen ligase
MLSSDLYKLRYLLLIQLLLITIFTFYGIVPLLLSISVILLLALLYLSFNYPIIALHTLIFSILVDSFIPMQNTSGPSLLVVEFFLVTLVGLMTIKFLLNLNDLSDVHKLIFAWLPFLIWSLLIGLLVAIDKFRVITYWKNYFAGFFTFSLAYYSIRNKSSLKSIIIGLITWGLVLSLIEIKILFDLGGFTIGIVGLFLKKNLLTVGWGRSNYLAAFFVIIIPVTIGYLYYNKSKRIKLFLSFSLVLMFFAIILTLSRGGILALIIALIILFARVLKSRTLIPFILLFLLVTTVLLLNPLTYVLFDRISAIETSGSYFSRINFYLEVWAAFLKNPITGVGIGNLSYYATFIIPSSGAPSAHNIILGALGEIGIIGAFFYFILLGLVIRIVYNGYRREKEESLKILRWCFFASIVGGLVHTLVEPTLEGLQFSIIFWTIVGISIRLDLLKSYFI